MLKYLVAAFAVIGASSAHAYCNDPSNPACATPSYLTINGAAVSASNPLPTSGGGGGGSGGTVTQGAPGTAATAWYVQGSGTAGVPLGNVLSIQGVTGGTPQAVSQSGVWSEGRTWNLSGSSDSVSLTAGTATIGSIANTSFGRTWNLSSGADSVTASINSIPLAPNAAQETGGNLATIAGAQGTDATAVTQPTGGAGIRGWLSGIYKAVTGTLTVGGTVTATQTIGTNLHVVVDSGTITTTGGGGGGTTTVVQPTASLLNATVTANSLPLPTGAAISANQPTNAAQGSTTATQTGNLVMGATSTATPTYTTAQTNPLSLTTAGALRTDASATTQPISAVALPLPTGAATAANQTGGNQKTQVVDGSGNVMPAGNVATNPVFVSSSTVNGSAISAARTSVTTTATQVISASTTLVVRNVRNDPTSTVTMYIGPSGVTATTGYPLAPGESFDFSKLNGAVFAITSSGTATADTITY